MKKILFIAIVFIAGSACKKVNSCKGNCADMLISGKVYDITTNRGLSDHTIFIRRRTKACLLCNMFSEVAKIYSDANGNFSAQITIDTTDFHGTYLVASAAERAGYNKLFQDTIIGKFTPSLFLDIKFQP